MTPEEQKAAEEEIICFQQENPNYWGDQDENGVDLAHLRENLMMTPAERLDKHGIAFALAMELRDGIERSRTTQKSSPSL